MQSSWYFVKWHPFTDVKTQDTSLYKRGQKKGVGVRRLGQELELPRKEVHAFLSHNFPVKTVHGRT